MWSGGVLVEVVNPEERRWRRSGGGGERGGEEVKEWLWSWVVDSN
jgi:hypothetical protein